MTGKEFLALKVGDIVLEMKDNDRTYRRIDHVAVRLSALMIDGRITWQEQIKSYRVTLLQTTIRYRWREERIGWSEERPRHIQLRLHELNAKRGVRKLRRIA